MKSILKISEAASLALHTMYFVAGIENGDLINTKDIADQLQVSEAHLRKVVQRLVKAGFIETFRGPKGGIKLAKNGENTTLMEIYEAIESPMTLSDCLLSERFCDIGQCMMSDLIVTINAKVVEYFSKTKISDFKAQAFCPKASAN